MFSRIVITGDVLRPHRSETGWESATWKNVRWLHHVLSHPLESCGFPVSTLAWDDKASPHLNTWLAPHALYDQLQDPLCLDSWARLCSRQSAPDELVRWLEPFVADALVIGYEMPEVMGNALQKLGRPYLDLILHPLRFMPDLVFALRTNVRQYHRVLECFRLPESSIRQQASLICAKAAWMAPPEPMPPGTALVLGQVASDRAMIAANGKFTSLADHVECLHTLCFDHPLVLYKPHPYAGPDDPSRTAVDRLPAIRITNANFYHLLAQPEVEIVVALNSSGLFEARCFGRKTCQLMPSLYDFQSSFPPENGQPGSPVPLMGAWMQADFWRGLLLDRGEPESEATRLPLPEPNRLRRSMNADWGYHFVERICA